MLRVCDHSNPMLHRAIQQAISLLTFDNALKANDGPVSGEARTIRVRKYIQSCHHDPNWLLFAP